MTEEEKKIIEYLITEVRKKFDGEGTGHDWWHIERVFKLASYIAEKEKAGLFMVQAGALLHDIADHKFHDDHKKESERSIRYLLTGKISEEKILQLISLVEEISFKGANVADTTSSIEAKIVQDADRLDAIGAIGIARAFAYGGSKSRMIYNPEEKAELHEDFDSYRKSEGCTINHFYEKLLLIHERLHTVSAKEIGSERHKFIEQYLEQFYFEWNLLGIEQ